MRFNVEQVDCDPRVSRTLVNVSELSGASASPRVRFTTGFTYGAFPTSKRADACASTRTRYLNPSTSALQ